MENETKQKKRGNNMKVTIGEKIKRLRKKMGLTQEFVHHNQSQISQIESGRITNPDENTLLLIARNMEISFKELIDGTTWVKPEEVLMGKEITFSPTMYNINVDDFGNVTWSHKSYPLYNQKGEKNNYCPETGVELIHKCWDCDRAIETVEQIRCIGCGRLLFEVTELPPSYISLISEGAIFNSYESLNRSIRPILRDLYIHKQLLYTMMEVAFEDNIDEQEKLLENAKTAELFTAGSYQLQYIDNYIKDLKEFGKLKTNILPQLYFFVQVLEVTVKKVQSQFATLPKPGPLSKEIDRLYHAIALKIQKTITFENLPSLNSLIELLKDLIEIHSPDELISKLQSTIDIKAKQKVENKKNSGDGNPESTAAEKAEQEIENAEEKNKESNND
jgi:transcriptional regulator with XRE-family HTH domain